MYPFSAWNMGQLCSHYVGYDDGTVVAINTMVTADVARGIPLVDTSSLLAAVFAAVALAVACSNYKDTIHTANELPLGEIQFLILYLLIWWCFLENPPHKKLHVVNHSSPQNQIRCIGTIYKNHLFNEAAPLMQLIR